MAKGVFTTSTIVAKEQRCYGMTMQVKQANHDRL
jgi:hypothetical protein